MNRRLYRCRHDRRIAGVASGVAEYFDLDPTLVRILWFVSIFFGGLSLVLYIGLAIIVPNEPLTAEEIAMAGTAGIVGPPGHRHATTGRTSWASVLGIVLIVLGTFALLDLAVPGWHAVRYFWPAALLVVGGVLVATALRRNAPAATVEPPTASGPGEPDSATPPDRTEASAS